jgi:small subunit ribosomal protein S6
VTQYEILLLLDPELAEDRQTEIVGRVKDLVQTGEGTWLSHDLWGRRRLAYEIDKKPEGVYHLLNFDAEPATLDEISRILKITDGVMRHLATHRLEGGKPGPEPVGPPLGASSDRSDDRDETREYAGSTASAPVEAAPEPESEPESESEPASESEEE